MKRCTTPVMGPTLGGSCKAPRSGGSGGGSGAGAGRDTRSGVHEAVPPLEIAVPNDPIFLMTLARRGGSGKTTTTCNVSWALAARGANVLMVDLDPQCDLTRYQLRQLLENVYHGDYQAMISRGNCTGGATGNNCRTMLEAMRNFVILNQPTAGPEVEPYEIETPVGANITGSIFLVAGNEDTTELETKIGIVEAAGWNCNNIETLSYPHKILRECAIRHNCQFIVMDSNPYSGSLNCVLYNISDYTFVPLTPDHASKHSIKALTDTILKPATGWHSRKLEILRNFQMKNQHLLSLGAPEVVPFPNKTPKFLGIIVGNYRALRLDDNNFVQGLANDRPSLAYYRVMTDMRNEAVLAMGRMQTNPSLSGTSLTVASECFGLPGVNLVQGLLARIRHFHSVHEMSQQWGIPVSFLQSAHLQYIDELGITKTSTNRAQDLHRVQFFRKVYDQLSYSILMLIHKDSNRVAAPEDWSARQLGGPGVGNFFTQVQLPDQAFYEGH